MKKFTAYRLFLLWDNLQSRQTNYDKAAQCAMQKVRLVVMYDLN